MNKSPLASTVLSQRIIPASRVRFQTRLFIKKAAALECRPTFLHSGGNGMPPYFSCKTIFP
jgi:hypothetical protein